MIKMGPLPTLLKHAYGYEMPLRFRVKSEPWPLLYIPKLLYKVPSWRSWQVCTAATKPPTSTNGPVMVKNRRNRSEMKFVSYIGYIVHPNVLHKNSPSSPILQ